MCGLTFFGTPFSPVSRSPNHAFQVNGCLCAVEVGAFSSDGVYALLCVVVGILVVAMFSLVHRSYSISFTRAQGIPKYTVNRASTNGVQTQLSAPFERHPRTGYNRNSLHRLRGSDHGWLVGAGGVTRRGLPCTYPHLHPHAHTPHPPTCCVADGGAPGCGGPAGYLPSRCGRAADTLLWSQRAGHRPDQRCGGARTPVSPAVVACTCCVRAPLCTHSMSPPMTLLCHCPLCLGLDP